MEKVKETIESNFDESILCPEETELVLPVYTLPLHEFKFRDFCQKNGIVTYLPLKKEWKIQRRRYKDRSYEYPCQIIRPMFASYAFARLTAEQRSLIYRSNSIVRILEVTQGAQSHLLDEIKVISQIEKIGLTEELEFNSDVKEGQRFLIESGPWAGVYGWLRKRKKRFNWTVELECVNGLVTATIDASTCKMTPAEQS